mgnify:CR=1 FL=1
MMFFRVRLYRVLIRLASWLRMRRHMNVYYQTMHFAMLVLFGPRDK